MLSALAALLLLSSPEFRKLIAIRSGLILWAALIGLAALSVNWSVAPDLTLSAIKKELLYPLFAFGIFYLCCQQSTLQNYTIIGLGIGYTALLFLSINFKLGLIKGGSDYYLMVGDTSTLITLAVCVFCSICISNRRLWILLLALTGLAVSGYSLSLIQNRMAIICVGFVAAFFSLVVLFDVVKCRKQRGLVLILIPILLAVSTLTALNMKQSGNISEVTALKKDPRANTLWPFYLSQYDRAPHRGFGYGYSIPGQALSDEMPENFNSNYRLHAHNVLLNRYLQLGWPGLLLFMALYGWLIYRMVLLCKQPENRHLGLLGISLTLVFFLKSMTDDFFIRNNIIIFWALMGLILASAVRPAKKTETEAIK